MTIDIRPLEAAHLDDADRIFRLAFGTFLGLPQPMDFAAGADLLRTRWRAGACHALFGAFDGGELIGSNCVANWGSFGFFGPLTVHPSRWEHGIAQRLLEPTMDTFAAWGVRQAGLFTFPHSAKHLGLYQKHDFWPQQLTAVMAKPVAVPPPSSPATTDPVGRDELLAAVRAVGDAVFPGLDVTGEARAVLDQGIGEVVTVQDGGRVVAFAVCHHGAGSEAGPDTTFVKVAAARPGALAALLQACEAAAAARGMRVLSAGVNTACHDAYRTLIAQGMRTQLTGVAMQRGNRPGFLVGDALVLGDWR